jgi:hypothetical protein
VYLATASATSRTRDVAFRAVVYNKGAMVLHMLARLSATTRSSADSALLRRSRGSRRRAPKICARRWKPNPGVAGAILRAVDLQRTLPRVFHAIGLKRYRRRTDERSGNRVLRFEQTGDIFDCR